MYQWNGKKKIKLCRCSLLAAGCKMRVFVEVSCCCLHVWLHYFVPYCQFSTQISSRIILCTRIWVTDFKKKTNCFVDISDFYDSRILLVLQLPFFLASLISRIEEDRSKGATFSRRLAFLELRKCTTVTETWIFFHFKVKIFIFLIRCSRNLFLKIFLPENPIFSHPLVFNALENVQVKRISAKGTIPKIFNFYQRLNPICKVKNLFFFKSDQFSKQNHQYTYMM